MLVWYSTCELKHRRACGEHGSVHRNRGRGGRETARKRSTGDSSAIDPGTLRWVLSARCAEQAPLLERGRVLVHALEPRACPTSGGAAPLPGCHHRLGHSVLGLSSGLDRGAFGANRTPGRTAHLIAVLVLLLAKQEVLCMVSFPCCLLWPSCER